MMSMSDATGSPHIVVTSEKTFERDVIERSKEVPVVVDFWAGWCQPCRLLAPILEALARERQGAFVLVKADIEEMPNIAAAFRVRSIPSVFGFKGGQAVDSFLGLLPESAIRAWIDRLMPTAAEKLTAQARQVAATDAARAEQLYCQALELAPNDPGVKIDLARFLLGRDRIDEGQALIAKLEGRGFLEPEAERLKAELALRAGARDAGDLAARRSEAAVHPDDLGLRFKLAEALAAAGQNAEALELCLSVVEESHGDLRDAARKLMLSIFQLLPEDDDLAAEYRRKLSAALY
jgi:putative thioredoxin